MAYSCPLWPNETIKCASLVNVRRVMASFSLLGCLFITGSIIVLKKYRYFPQRLIFFLSVAALIDSISFLMSEVQHSVTSLCITQAFFMSYFDWAVLLWVCCITWNLYQSIVKQTVNESLEKYYHIICWGWPLLMAVIPLFKSAYGPASLWCWIEEDYTAMRFALWYIPLFTLIAVLFFSVIFISRRVSIQTRTWGGTYDPEVEHIRELMREHVKPLRLYPMIFLFCSLFGLMNRIQNAVSPGDPSFVLMVLHALFAPLQGLLNALAYGMDKETLSRCNWPYVRTVFSRRSDKSRIMQEYPISNSGDHRESTDSGSGSSDFNMSEFGAFRE